MALLALFVAVSCGGSGGQGPKGDGGTGGSEEEGGNGGSGSGGGGSAGGSKGSIDAAVSSPDAPEKGGAGGTSSGGAGGAGGGGGRTPDAGAGGRPVDGPVSGGGAGGAGGAGGGGEVMAMPPCSGMPAATPPTLKRTLIANVPGQPGQVVAVPGEQMLYVLGHKNGNVYALMPGTPTPVATMAHVNVATGGNDEQGLLGMAFHPDFANNHLFYLLYTATGAGHITVDEFERMTPTTSVKKRNIWDKARTDNNALQFHNGGSLSFNPKDGVAKPILYHSVGNNKSDDAGNPNGVAGRVLAHNLTGGTVASSTYVYGLRNPYRMSIDRLTGDMYLGDVAEGKGGSVFFNPNGMSGKTFGYSKDGGEIAGGISGRFSDSGGLIGGIVYRGNKIPEICGRYFFAMWDSGTVRSFVVQNGARVGDVVGVSSLNTGSPSSFGEDGDGEMIISAQGGQVYRVEK